MPGVVWLGASVASFRRGRPPALAGHKSPSECPHQVVAAAAAPDAAFSRWMALDAVGEGESAEAS